MSKTFQNALLATAAAAVFFALPLAGAAEAGPRHSDREFAASQHEREAGRRAGRRDRGEDHTRGGNRRVDRSFEAGRRDRERVYSQQERGPFQLAARRDRFDVRTPLINRRIDNQARRIAAGVRTGDLTRFETMRLRSRLMAIRTALRLARVDGHVSAGERRAILGMLNENSQRIARLRHNRRFN